MTFAELIKEKEGYIGSNGRSDEEIQKHEQKLGANFSKEYSNYLKEIGLASFEGTELTGICSTSRLNVAEATLKFREECTGLPQNLYIVEKIGMDNLMVWQSSTGEVFVSNSEYQFQKVADSLVQYYS